MGVEIQKAAKGVLHDHEKHPHSVPSLHPLLYSFSRHHGYPMKQMSVLLENRPEFARHGQGYANIGHLWESGLQILLPRFRGTVSTACTESRLAGVIDNLALRT